MEVLVKMSGSPEEWGLIELQGELETQNKVSYESLRIGDLHICGSSANLVVGHHLLTGVVVNLDPPLAVLKKEHRSAFQTDYNVTAFIRKKYLFKNRPKPLVSNT